MAYGQSYASWGAQGGAQAQSQWGAQAQGGQQQHSWGGAQQQGSQQAWGQQNAWGQQAQQQPAQQQQAAQPQAAGKDVTLVVTGCTHSTVGPIVRGSFQLHGENHGKPTYKKDCQVNGLDVMSYYWDERDGPGFCGWWFGPKVGGDQVWAYHTDKNAGTPPSTGWKVPYDGPVDPTFVISVKPKAAAAAAPQQYQQAQAQQQQQQQQWNQAKQAQAQQQWNQGNQGQWGQQQQQQGWGQQQAGMQANMEEQKKLQEQKRQLEQLKAKQQQAEQAKRMEEQRLKMEEGKRQQAEEQKRKMEEMKQRQQEIMKKKAEEEKKKQEEMEKKRQEQVAVLAIRRVMQKYRAVLPDKYNEVKQELDEVIAQHLEATGSQKEKLTTEIEQVVSATKQRIEQVEEVKRKEEEKKQAELAKKKEAREKALSLCKDLEAFVVKAEESSNAVVQEAEPFTGDKEMSVSEVEQCAVAIEDAGKEASAAAQAASDFVAKESASIRNAPPIPGEPASTAPAELAKLMARLAAAKKATQESTIKATGAKTIRLKKAQAKEKFEKSLKVFKKYAKDNKLGKREIQQFAKGEYSFTVPSQVLDTALRVLGKEVSKDKFQALKSMIGVAREAAIDEKRKKAKEEREKMIAAKKETLQEEVKSAGELITAATETINTADKASAPLGIPAKAKTMTSAEMVALADEVDTSITASKVASAKATEAVKALAGETEAELKAFLTGEVKKLEANMKNFDQRVAKFVQTCAKWRADAQKKAHAELEKLRVDGIAMMYRYMGEKKLDGESLFKAIDKNKNGKIEEGELLKFFKANLKTAGENGDAIALPDEEVQRLFSYLDSDEDGCLPKDKFLSIIRKFMKAVKASVITEDISIKSKIIRRLEEGEVLEVITGPTKEQEDSVISRLRVKAMQDGTEGWVTPVGNQGTVFLEEGGGSFKVVKETILTGAFVIGGDSKMKDRKLKVGEICEVREWAKKEESSGLMRMKVRVQSDGQIGYVTSVGNTGIKFLEMA